MTVTHVHRAYVQFRFGLQIYIFWYFVFVGFVFNIAAISFMVFAVVFVFWFFYFIADDHNDNEIRMILWGDQRDIV